MVPMPNTIVVPHPQVMGQMLANEAVLLVPHKGEVKVLNEVGARIWALLDGRRTLREIAKVICAEYHVEQTQAERDTLAFVQELALREMVLHT